MVIKLDFRKAFDSISWSSLLLLNHWGYPTSFCSWIENLLTTGKTAILLNGVPGLHQLQEWSPPTGPSPPPYLFIIVADILQQLILKAHASNLGHLQHPIYPDLPPTILQYADDTHVIARASTEAASHLKSILDDFALATGLTINVTKTAFVLIHVNNATAASIAVIVGCTTPSFPPTYLGLPLSTHKLLPSAFQPIITNCFRYLTVRRTKLLSRGGRLILICYVLDSLPTYFMSVFQLPKKVIKATDSIRRAFFWTAEEMCTGAKCLIVWKNVCKPKKFGGLGIKDLHIQNNCLLLKFAYKCLTSTSPLPWITWYL